MSDHVLLGFYALGAVLVVAGSARILGPVAFGLLRWIASRFSWRGAIALTLGAAASIVHARFRPWPETGSNVILDLVAVTDPAAYIVLHGWSLVVPGLAVCFGVLGISGAWRVWAAEPGRFSRARGLLPPWPEENPDEPRLVIGELHHPTEGREIGRPAWLTLDERGLYTGMAIFGAVGTGKTSACMNPSAASSSPGAPTIRPNGQRAWSSKSKATSATRSKRCWSRRVEERTTSRSGWADAGSGTRWPRTWIPTASPTASPRCSISCSGPAVIPLPQTMGLTFSGTLVRIQAHFEVMSRSID